MIPNGFQQAFVAWNVPLDINMLLCIFMPLGAVVQDMMRRGASVDDLPKWLVFPAAIGDLMLWIFPWNFFVCLVLWQTTVILGAPTSTIIMAVCLTIICWCLAAYAGFIKPVIKNVL